MKETNKGWKVKMADVYWGWTPTLVRIYAWSVASDSFDPIDSSQRGSFIHGILQAIILEWVATSFSRGSFWPRDQTWNSCIGRWIFTTESPGKTPLGRIVQLLSHIQLFAIQWTIASQAPLYLTISWRLLKLIFIESVIPSNHLILWYPLLILPSIFPSLRVFSNELALCIRWPKYWSFSFSISPSNEYSGLTFFRIDCFDLLGVQGTLKSLLQHHSSKASILWCSGFFCCPALTSVHDYWKNQSFDYMDLCWQSNVSSF